MRSVTGFTNNLIHQSTVIIISLLIKINLASVSWALRKILSNRAFYHFSSVNADERTGG